MRKLGIGTVIALVCSVGGTAAAQEVVTETELAADTTLEPTGVGAPRKAFEIGVNGGYTQPFGEIQDGQEFQNLTDAGGSVGLTLGYRFTPRWSIEGVGTFNEMKVDDRIDGERMDVRGMSAGLQGTFHMLPYDRVDPYISLGGGFRTLWTSPQGESDTFTTGLQLAKAVIGADFRVSRDVALGPMVGADVNVFLWETVPSESDADPIEDVRPSTYLFAGMSGRFDIGGDRVVPARNIVFNERTPTPAAGTPPAPPPAPAPAPPTNGTSTGIAIDPRILEACKIENKKAYFEFDKSDVQAQDRATLDLVAECFKTGPLKGRGMNIIGRADPRGTKEYNQKLGETRAEAVEGYLEGQGLSDQTMVTESTGEEYATGTDESGWAIDRRVDLRLKDEPAPSTMPDE